MKKIAKAIILFLLLISESVTAQELKTETEFGTNGEGKHFFSQYVFYDEPAFGLRVRYFRVKNGVNRGEFGFGPTFKIKNVKVKVQFGFTTDRELMLVGSANFKLKNRIVTKIADAKFATQNGKHNSLFQKLFVGINNSNTVLFRTERSQVGKKQSYWRFGIELRKPVLDNSHFYIAPFCDPFRKSCGMQGGFRY